MEEPWAIPLFRLYKDECCPSTATSNVRSIRKLCMKYRMLPLTYNIMTILINYATNKYTRITTFWCPYAKITVHPVSYMKLALYLIIIIIISV